jgi:hypothetical protein
MHFLICRDSIVVTPNSYDLISYNLVEICISVKGPSAVKFTLFSADGQELKDDTVCFI